MEGWSKKRVLIAVRTYPSPAQRNIEVSCTAGITKDGKWIRLFPVPYRFLDEDKRFAKYQWIDVDVIKASQDTRPESYKLNIDTIKIGESVSATDSWRGRKEIVRPLLRRSMCQIRQERDADGSPTLGLFKPAKIKRLIIEAEENPDWTPQQIANLDQTMLFQAGPSERLEKIPYKFKYQFECTERGCRGHTMSCTDWEMGEAYRRWRKEYGDSWESKFRQKFEDEMTNKRDTHFYVGTVHKHPKEWIIVGLFYPPQEAMRDLFDNEAGS